MNSIITTQLGCKIALVFTLVFRPI